MRDEILKKQLQQDQKLLYSIEAEQIILGSLIMNNDYLDKISEIITAESFYEPVHAKIYERISQITSKIGLVANSITLKGFFEDDDDIKENGGARYLSVLMAKATGVFDVLQYARIIKELYLKREIVEICENAIIEAKSHNSDLKSEEQVEKIESDLFNMSNLGSTETDFNAISSSLKDTVENINIAMNRDNHISGISTGFSDLDKILGGMQNSDLIILAGRPSMGKTALGINIALNACKFINNFSSNNKKEKLTDESDEKEKAVGFISLEMSAEQLTARMLSMETTISTEKFRQGYIDKQQYEVIVQRSFELSSLPFYIDDTPAMSIASIRNKIRRMIRKHNLSFVVIDYLQLMRGSNLRSSDVNRVQEISEITQGLKAIAKEFNIPVMALSQLSRAVEQRDDKRPQLSDLRESGSIEQDSDVVLFIYRDSYYHERKKPEEPNPDYDDPEIYEKKQKKLAEWNIKMESIRNKSEVMIAKHRNGAIGNIVLKFNPQYTIFSDNDDNKYLSHQNN